MDRALAIVATIVVGGVIAFQPPVNSQLARHVSVIGAAMVSTAVSTLLLVVLFVAIKRGDFSELGQLSGVPWYQLTGGIMGGILVAVSLVTVRTLGASGVVAATVAGQLIVSAVLDRAGVLGLEREGLTPIRLLGMGLLVVGVLLVTQPAR
jgi:bacterial/archaeal transporter family-2 protein